MYMQAPWGPKEGIRSLELDFIGKVVSLVRWVLGTEPDQQVLFFKHLFIYYAYNILLVCMPAGQKRAPDPITDGCEPPCGFWELNSGPLEEQSVLLTAEPSLQP